jgi:hypothetical protein
MSEDTVNEIFEYEVNGNIYTQQKMKLGQVKQLNKMFANLVLPGNITAITMFTTFGDQLSEFMAVVLCKKGTELKDKDFDALVLEFESYADMDVGFKVIQDFFVCNPIASYFTQMTSAFETMMAANK